jgi:hypothetical protein
MFSGPIGKQMMIEQGYVPPTCTLPDEMAGPIIYSEVSAGRSPCDGCNEDRLKCKGRPSDPKYGNPERPKSR